MPETPRLSVVMPMHNCAHCVCAMLDSLLAQPISMQFIIVDDASEDDSVAQVKAWSRRSAQPVTLLQNRAQGYSYAARLQGMAAATSPVIWNVDADDIIPDNANVLSALEVMEHEMPDILHCKAGGVDAGSSLQRPLPWTEPPAEKLDGEDICKTFLAQSYPPAILWNKFFSARVVKTVLKMALPLRVRYFDVKFLGMYFLLAAQSYRACNALIYEYRMRAHRPAWLYARQINALLLLERALSALVKQYASSQLPAFLDYCHRRQVIQAGHLALMAESELHGLPPGKHNATAWLHENVLANIGQNELLIALRRSLAANALRLHAWSDVLLALQGVAGCVCPPDTAEAEADLHSAAQAWLLGERNGRVKLRLSQAGFFHGLSLSGNEHPPSSAPSHVDAILALFLANAQLARTITDVMAPGSDITKKAN